MPIFKLIILYLNKNSEHIASLYRMSFNLSGQVECAEENGRRELLMQHLISSSALSDRDLVLQDSEKLGEVFQWKRGIEENLWHK